MIYDALKIIFTGKTSLFLKLLDEEKTQVFLQLALRNFFLYSIKLRTVQLHPDRCKLLNNTTTNMI